jgi:hypothetical protein
MDVYDDHPKRCGATVEYGPKRRSGVVYGRRSCRAWPLKGYDHCRYHLTFEEYERWRRRAA